MQACSMAAPARALAAAGALHLVFMVAPAASQPQNGAASARARAEELAEQASRRFGELLAGEPAAQAEHARPASLAGPWKEALGWIERSNRDFDGLLRRLAGGEVGLRAEAAKGPGWLGRAQERFETIMRRLTEGATPQEPPHAAPPDPRGAGPNLAREAPRAPDAGTIASERPLAERRHAAPAPAASSAPGGDTEKTSSERRPDAKVAAPAAEPQPPARAALPATAAPRQREAGAVKAGEVKQTARSGNGALPSEAKPAAAGPANATTQRADRGATGAGIAAAHTQAKPAAERANKKTFAKRRAHRVARAQPPAAASARAAAHRHARRGVRHRHAKASHACDRLGADVAPPGWYVVNKGDTLWGISRHHYGNGRRYRRIAAANRRRLHGTNRIHACERLYLPGVPRG